MVLDGMLEIYPNKIVIKTLPHGVQPVNVEMNIGKAIISNKPNFINQHFSRVVNNSSEHTECQIEVSIKQGVDVFSTLTQFRKYIGFERKWTPSYTFVDRLGKVTSSNPLHVVQEWYLARKRAIRAELSSGQSTIVNKIRLLEAQIQIGDHREEAIDIVFKSSGIEVAVPRLCDRFQLTKTQAYAFFDNARVKDFLKDGHQTLVTKLKELVDKLNQLQYKFRNTDDTIIEDGVEALGKFPELMERLAVPSNFVGALVFKKGVIQFETFDELLSLLDRFDDFEKLIIYPKVKRWKALCDSTGWNIENNMSFPKEFTGTDIVVQRKTPKFTCVLNPRTLIYHSPRMDISLNENEIVSYVGDEVTTVSSAGNITRCYLKEVSPKRNTHKSSGVKTELVYVSNSVASDMVIAYCDTPNTIKLERVGPGGRAKFTPASMKKDLGAWISIGL